MQFMSFLIPRKEVGTGTGKPSGRGEFAYHRSQGRLAGGWHCRYQQPVRHVQVDVIVRRGEYSRIHFHMMVEAARDVGVPFIE